MEKTEPILAPCCADTLHIDGTIVLAISVGTEGDVTYVKVISGHPLMFGVTIESVRHWKFRPYTSQGVKKSFCGQLALHLQANEYRVKYKMVLAAPANPQTIALLSCTGLGQTRRTKARSFFKALHLMKTLPFASSMTLRAVTISMSLLFFAP